ncbi:MAG: aldo/keto reductase [Planctomycetaceae bacterium]|nr:aldo/keto reductase [Planctomycetaceae bacterium]|tara:strand:+ start:129 stop:1103 length:975 start_codon:yes stop_codon:yes gene_type:complete
MSAFETTIEIGTTGIHVTPVAMGCWPISGVTTLGVTDAESVATLEAALDSGVNFFDTAFCYGYEGESEKLIGRGLGHRRDEVVIATKGGVHWENRIQQRDARPETLRRQCDESLQRLDTDRIDLYYIHAPDPAVPVSESAGGLKHLLEEGKILSVGVSNFTADQMEEFSAVCPISASQPHYNMLQREIEDEHLPWCRQHGVSVMAYWVLLKGLLAGHLSRDHVFESPDGRAKYPMFQGAEYQRNLDFVDSLRPIASDADLTVSQLVIAWTLAQPGISVALCGGRRPEQIRESAVAMGADVGEEVLGRVDQAIAARGDAASRPPI